MRTFADGRPRLRGRWWCVALGVAWGGVAQPASADQELTLYDCLAAAVQWNPAIQSAQLEPLLAEADYLAAQGVFDPTLFINYTFTDRVDPLSQRTIRAIRGVVTAVQSRTTIVSGGVGGVGAAGTQYNVTFQSTRTESTINSFFGTNGEYEIDLTATVTQPLLRNFGVGVTTTGVRVADLGRHLAAVQLEAALIDTLFAVENAYWQLVLAREQLRVQHNGRALGQKLVEETQARLAVGVVAPLAVLEAETALARREEGVLLAKQAVGNAEDALRRSLSASAAQALWTDPIVPLDSPEAEPLLLDMDAAVGAAVRRRVELALLHVGLKQAALQTAFQKNQRLPELNFVGEYGFRAIQLGRESAVDDILAGKNVHWLVGMEMEVPWSNRAARGAYRRARLTEDSTRLQLRRAEQQITQDARTAVRRVSTGLQEIVATRTALRLALEQLRAEEAKLAVGVATPFDVREKQDALIEQQGRTVQALVGYQLAAANLARARGDYLDRIGLDVRVGAAGGMRDVAVSTAPVDAGSRE